MKLKPKGYLPEPNDEVLVAFRRPIELTTMSSGDQPELCLRLIEAGIHPATVGHRVEDGSSVNFLQRRSGPRVLLNGKPIATVGSAYNGVIDPDAHGCPACPHPALGVVVTGFPNVLIGGRPIAVAGSETSTGGFVAEGVTELPGSTRRITRAGSIAMRRLLRRG